MPILYSSQAGKAPPWQGGVSGAGYTLHCLYLLSKGSQTFFVFVPVGMPDVCMWYVVLGMRYEVRGMRYVVQSTGYVVRGMECIVQSALYGT